MSGPSPSSLPHVTTQTCRFRSGLPESAFAPRLAPNAANCANKVAIGQITSSGGSNPSYSVSLQRLAGGALMVELAMLAFPATVNVPTSTMTIDMKTAQNVTVTFANGPGLDVNALVRKMDAFNASRPTLSTRNCYYPNVRGF